jgi:18S rRNA (guanine1575-N7)-methyltransferase
LAVGARAVIQIYPENDALMTMLKSAALQAGCIGGIPDSTKAKETFLVLNAGPILAKNSTVKKCQVIQEDHVLKKPWMIQKKE